MDANKIPRITLNRHADKRLRDEHPWIFSNEIGEVQRWQKIAPGELVEVLDCHGDYVGTGYSHPKSLIAIRILTRKREEIIDSAFWERMLGRALDLRAPIYGKSSGAENTYRAVFGESDGLPGLVIDRLGPVWVLQPHALGIRLRIEEIASALEKAVAAREGKGALQALVLRTDVRSGKLEDMAEESRLLRGELPREGVFAVESHLRFPVDVLDGQKTGFFFDQRENRAAFARWIAANKADGRKIGTVLDAYCHLGAWGLQALAAGAERCVFVDQSAAALKAVEKTAKAKGWESRIEVRQGDAEKIMKELPSGGFAAVALDPPAFIQSKKDVAAGLRMYRQMNALAARLVEPGGILSTSSCSYHCEEGRFEEEVGLGLRSVGRTPQILQRGQAAWDHPAIAGMRESRYLKNILLRL